MSAADPLEALRVLLLADAGVQALVADRVRCLELHEGDFDGETPRASVLLKPAGGPASPGYMQHGKSRIDVTCFGGSLDESWDAYLAVYPVLAAIKSDVSQGVLLHSAACVSKGAAARDPVKQWPTTYSTWLVHAAEIPVT